MNAINTGEKVQQNDTILCNGPRLVEKDGKYIIIDLYKKVHSKYLFYIN